MEAKAKITYKFLKFIIFSLQIVMNPNQILNFLSKFLKFS